ncbi:flagellar basal body-associated protein FliL [Oleiphilus messinensis]|uniref:Flagellar protein FliL n=1 Tax=Oleiphilus messinensis TaxID=141451 RepID=A0A1Y0IDX7_9GAMM|nr:flagellar basal body-associated FliL family protein [Oleiphilus messinensis]ARU57574.1 flagellar basal body-associated protein FliL [Oleiphilus messinensis]
MAEKGKAAAEGDAAEGGKSNKKLIVILAIVVLLSIGISVGVTLFFLSGNDSTDNVEETPSEPVQKTALYTELKPPFVVALNVDNRQRYLQIYVSIMSRDQGALDTLDQHMPVVRSKLIALFSGQDFMQLQTGEGKQALQDAALDVVTNVLDQEGASGSIEKVLFTNFVMQ